MRLLLLVTLLLVAAAPAHAADPSLILHGGVVWTGGDRPAEAVAVEGERLAAVGSSSEVRALAGPRTRVVNLNGAMVVPGFADHHTHILEQGNLGSLEPSWSGYNPAASEAVRAAILGQHTAQHSAGQTPEDGCSSSAVTDSMKETILGYQDLLAKQGLTTVVEAGLSDLGWLEALRQLEAEGKLKVRFVIRVGWGCIEQAAALGLRSGAGSQWVKILGVKLYSDGWLGPRTAALREPYDDRPHSGFLFLGQPRADADVARARELGFNVTTHAIGDRGLETMLTAYEHNGVGAGERAQLEHAQVLDDDLIKRMGTVGAIASVQLSFATTDMRFAEEALGPERAARAYAWRTLLQRGVRLVGGSDFPVEQINPLWGVQRIVTRQEFDGTPPGGWHPDQRLTVQEALRLITADGALARMEERERGALEPGRFADLVVIRENLLSLPADCLAAGTVLMTVVNGRIAFEGAQAYPPGDATCPSAKAPAAEPKLTEETVAKPVAPESPSPAGAACPRPAALARVRGRSIRVTPPKRFGTFSAEVVRLGARAVSRLGVRRRAFNWRADRVRPGWYVLRLRSGPRGVREVAVRRDAAGAVEVRPPFVLSRACGAIAAFRLSVPVFGADPLDIAYRLNASARVTVEVRQGDRVVQRLAQGDRRARRTYRLRFAGGGRPAGDYTVRVVAERRGRAVAAELVAAHTG
jgi:hypothetical protein